MSILGSNSKADFRSRIWQREPLLVRNAVEHMCAIIDRDDLAGLACEDGVESRLVLRERISGRWRVEHGPFEERRFSSLGDCDWTLLVNSVEQWMPEVATVLDDFDFLPRWRVDDIMVSAAGVGGGVGPHFDYYDVFLLQVTGRRRWQLGGRCDDNTVLASHAGLRLLESFDADASYDLGPGDMLYVPAGFAHCGTAMSDDCMTWSIGFRAPSLRELLPLAAGLLVEEWPQHTRYRDPCADLEVDRFEIGEGVRDYWRGALEQIGPDEMLDAVLQAFGREVTEPRDPDRIFAGHEASELSVERHLAAAGPLRIAHHPVSRLAYRPYGEAAMLFVDGDCYSTSVELAKCVCNGALESAADLSPGDVETLVRLVMQGSVSLE